MTIVLGMTNPTATELNVSTRIGACTNIASSAYDSATYRAEGWLFCDVTPTREYSQSKGSWCDSRPLSGRHLKKKLT